MTAAPPARIFIVEDDVLFTDLLKRFFDARPKGEATVVDAVRSNSDDLIERVKKSRATIALVDATLGPELSRRIPETQGVHASRRIKEAFGDSIRVILMSRLPAFEAEVTDADADYFVSKLEPLKTLTDAIAVLRAGGIPTLQHFRLRRLNTLKVDLRQGALKVGKDQQLSPWVPMEPLPLVLVAFLARERVLGGGPWLERANAGEILCRQPAIWTQIASITAAPRHDGLVVRDVNVWKYKVNEKLKSVAATELVQGPPPGRSTGPNHYYLLSTIPAGAIDIIPHLDIAGPL